jgi:hypothetical protein
MDIKRKALARVGLAAAATIALLGGSALALVPSASAQDADATPPTAERHEKRGRFLERVASLLGIDVAVLEQAIKDARSEAVEEKLAAGEITEERAAKARERIENGRGGGGFKERGERRHERKLKIRGALIEQAATALGITADDLKSELKAGKSVAEVASDLGVSLDDVKASILDAAKSRIDQAVANGRIDQPKADAALEKLSDRLDNLLNRKRAAPAAP